MEAHLFLAALRSSSLSLSLEPSRISSVLLGLGGFFSSTGRSEDGPCLASNRNSERRKVTLAYDSCCILLITHVNRKQV
jgi:hypothetical protein